MLIPGSRFGKSAGKVKEFLSNEVTKHLLLPGIPFCWEELDVAPFNYSLSTGMKNNHVIMDEESLELFYQRFGFVKNNLDGIEYFHRIVVWRN